MTTSEWVVDICFYIDIFLNFMTGFDSEPSAIRQPCMRLSYRGATPD